MAFHRSKMLNCQVILLLFSLCIWKSKAMKGTWTNQAVNNMWTSEPVNDEYVIFSQMICRHGDRNIFSPYSRDPNKSPKEWPGGWGSLTDFGADQHYELGEKLRNVYRHLIDSPDDIYVRSTDRQRTILSARNNLAALYPGQNIPIYTVQDHDDNLLLMKKQCPRFDYVMLQYMNEHTYKETLRKNQDLIRFLERHSGERLNTISAIWKLYDTLSVERQKNKILPQWAHLAMAPGGDFEKMALYWYTMYTRKTEMKKLRSGFLLKDLLDRADQKANGRLHPNRNLWMYFAHDTTIASLLDTLGLFNTPFVPPYASCFVFELIRGSSSPYVVLGYLKSPEDYSAFEIPGCRTSPRCTLRELRDIYDKVIPKQSFSDSCKLHRGNRLPRGGNPENKYM